MKRKTLERKLSRVKLVAVDTMVFIYLLEERKIYFPLAELIFNEMEEGKIKVLSSLISYIETLSSPLLDKERIDLYSKFFLKSKNLVLYDVDWKIADKAAFIRRTYGLRTPDAIQIATAIVGKVDLFISNEKNFKKVKEIKSLVLKDFV